MPLIDGILAPTVFAPIVAAAAPTESKSISFMNAEGRKLYISPSAPLWGSPILSYSYSKPTSCVEKRNNSNAKNVHVRLIKIDP